MAKVRVHGTDTAVKAKVLDLSGSGIRLWLPVVIDDPESVSIMLQSDDEDGRTVVLAAEIVLIASDDGTDSPGCEIACSFD
jgi:hypothetical protein